MIDEFNESVMSQYIVLKEKKVSPQFVETVLMKKLKLQEKFCLDNYNRLNLNFNSEDLYQDIKEIRRAKRILKGLTDMDIVFNQFKDIKVSKALAKEGYGDLARSLYEKLASTNWRYILSANPTDFFTVNDSAVFKSCYSIGHTFHRSVSCLCNDENTLLLYAVNMQGRVTGKMWFHFFLEEGSVYAGVRKYGYIPDVIIKDVMLLSGIKGEIVADPEPLWVEVGHQKKQGKHLDPPSFLLGNPLKGRDYAPSLCVSCGKEYEYQFGVEDSRYSVCKNCWDYKICDVCGQVECICSKEV
jgi:hypothetical protein